MCIVYGTCFLARGDSNGEHTTGVVPVLGPAVAAVGRNWVMSGTGVTHTTTPSLHHPAALLFLTHESTSPKRKSCCQSQRDPLDTR